MEIFDHTVQQENLQYYNSPRLCIIADMVVVRPVDGCSSQDTPRLWNCMWAIIDWLYFVIHLMF